MNGPLSNRQRLANDQETLVRGRTVGCSSSTVSEDGEVNNASLSLITELVLGRRTLMGGCSQEEADIKLEGKEGTEGKERGWKGRGRKSESWSKEKANPYFQIQKSKRK